MDQKSLLLIEATGIQEYIFSSNKLSQNIGASEIVCRATEDWVKAQTEPESIVYAGGGNAMLVFDDKAQATDLARRLTRHALEDAPGLQLVVAQQEYTPGRLAETHQSLRKKLAQRKLDRQFSTPLPGLGVTAACVYTGAPAVALNDEGQLISAEVQAKLSAEEDGKERLKGQLPEVAGHGYDFVYDFNDFGVKGESSYIAVIHTDGNRMGERIQALGQEHSADDAAYIQALRKFSDSVKKAARKALKSTVDLLLASVEEVEGQDGRRRKVIGGVVPCPERGGVAYLPFRPIVFGGDDVTFVCEGRLGLAVVAHYLRVFSEQELSDHKKAHARAGVAVVKSHYPFSRAYDLAEALCASAKCHINEVDGSGRLTAFDWHFAVSGLVLPLGQVRDREYTVPAGNLLMRPIRLNPLDDDWRSWDKFVRVVQEFREESGPWAGRRNKVKALRQALREGPAAVEHFLGLYPDLKHLPSIPGLPDMATQGWQGGRCGYFDAVEALDFYVPLEEERGR